MLFLTSLAAGVHRAALLNPEYTGSLPIQMRGERSHPRRTRQRWTVYSDLHAPSSAIAWGAWRASCQGLQIGADAPLATGTHARIVNAGLVLDRERSVAASSLHRIRRSPSVTAPSTTTLSTQPAVLMAAASNLLLVHATCRWNTVTRPGRTDA